KSLGAFDSGFVTLVNPCKMKGIDIFAALARAFPRVEFAAVPSWGTCSADLELLHSIPNMRMVEFSADIDSLLAQTRVLLVPSLIPEGFGLLPLESMLRGVPVISSDAG